MNKIKFAAAKPVWISGKETEKNLTAGFRSIFTVEPQICCFIRIAVSSIYRIYLNNEFIGFGPARGPHEYYRLDEWDIKDKIGIGENLLSIEVAGYNVNGYYLLDQPPFLQAEILSDGNIISATGRNDIDFKAKILSERVQKVQRFSFQRPFIEVYKLQSEYDRLRKEITCNFPNEKISILGEKKLIPRGVPYPKFSKFSAVRNISTGNIFIDKNKKEFLKKRELTEIGPLLGGFSEDELETIHFYELQKIQNSTEIKLDSIYNNKPIQLDDLSYHILDFGKNLTGFLGFKIECKKKTNLYLIFDEILLNDDVDFKRNDCCACITYEFAPGEFEVESIEPNTMRYIKFMTTDGECVISNIYLREYANPDTDTAMFSSNDSDLNKLFEAGRETFRQNAVDFFTDCPSRERAGWLCDSFFTSRVAMDLSGHTKVERCFFENYLLPQSFAHHPKGMLPMCYPAEHYDGRFIPNWAMWFVIELEEYFSRSGDRNMIDALKIKVIALLDYFKKFRNEDGLLERLENWIFVEWSKANEFIQDVNYPTNMLYAATLEAAGRLYNIPEYINDGKKIRTAILKQSFNGEFFIDNAIREKGILKVTQNKTEVCQYYAFFFGLATPITHPELWEKIKNKFGPKRDASKVYPDVYPANAFIGNYLRMELLSRYDSAPNILNESKDYFLYMANQTGTLWEFIDTRASCNHGFASHICHILYRDILGINKIDYLLKEITLKFSDIPLDWCEGRLPIGNDFIYLRWQKENKKIKYQITVPAGYKINSIPGEDTEAIHIS